MELHMELHMGSIWGSMWADRRGPIWAKEQNRNSHIHLCIFIYIHVYIYKYIAINIHIYICVHGYMYIYTCMYTYTHIKEGPSAFNTVNQLLPTVLPATSTPHVCVRTGRGHITFSPLRMSLHLCVVSRAHACPVRVSTRKSMRMPTSMSKRMSERTAAAHLARSGPRYSSPARGIYRCSAFLSARCL